ncbi:GbsR/MarR family transcriptional regulator [Candidatus Formimonas warabiya]|uniref:HTH-type transcriptional regulator n=1 Tax=Formimonas warabiya TaxID=1761012 RepID=A0A3G1KUW7_FORW1|nr:GbsR/MarR family transcriptional regulator [Candidatus Formimonas warabiya]ATW26226.1 hypothetical protein DCMF_16950 [Candidatus Formimonas warabiya]
MGTEEREMLDKARQIIINSLGEQIRLYGITPSNGRLFGILYFHEEPMTLDEMAQEMGMSKTAMSNVARSLIDVKMLDRVWTKGSRKHLYRARTDFFKNYLEFVAMQAKAEREIALKDYDKVEPIYEQLLQSSDDEIKRQAELDFNKIKEDKKYYYWLERVAKFLENEEIIKYVPKEEPNSFK